MDRPTVTLKLATSLDGRIATASGESRWITGEAARAEVHRLRAAHDAVMVGVGTVLADDPELLARTEPPPLRQPMRVVLDSRFSCAPRGRLFESIAAAPVLFIGAEGADAALSAALEAAGARTATVRAAASGVDLLEALAVLAREGVGRVMCEGGGVLAASLIAANVVDRLEWFRAPIVLGAEGRPAVAALEIARLSEAPAWRRVALRALGPDVWESYERVR